MPKSPSIVVIGSGFGGLASAVRLQARGYDVELVEARDQLGGRAYVYRQDGFTFDGGPTVITAPFLIDEIFATAGRRTEDYVRIVPVDPFYRIEFHDGRHFEYNGDAAEMERRVTAFAPGEADGYRRMIQDAKAIFQKGFVELADKPFLHLSDMLRIAPDLARLGAHRTVFEFVSRYIQDPMLRRVFSFHPLLVGGNPFQTTSIYALIHYLERHWGVHYAMGGTGAVVEAFGRVFQELGGRIRLSSPVRRILVEDDARRPRVRGVELATGEEIAADAVVSNADLANTYRKLVDEKYRRKNSDRRIEKMRYSMSLFVIYFGTKRQYPDIKHHTIILSESYRELLHDIFNRKVLGDQVSLYLHRPSATDPSMAPPGCDSFYVLAPVPNQLSGIDWQQEAPRFRDLIMKELERRMPGLCGSIVTERLLTPLDFETTLASYAGAAFSFEPVLTQSAWFRPHNASEDVDQLYFAGAGTHPGAGIPGVLSSAKIVERLVCESLPQPVYREAAKATAEGSKSFYFATRFFPDELARAAHAVYWFCRHTDDLVDECDSVEQGRMDLEEWSDALTRALTTGRSTHPVLSVFAQTVRDYRIPHQYPLELIEGMRMDLNGMRYKTFGELRQFCYRVASVVGLMMSHVIGFEGKALGHAVDLGIAMQLTNILRDVGEDLERGRIYFPQEDMERFGYSERDLCARLRNDAFRSLMRFQVARAREYYESAMPGIPLLDKRGRFAVRVAADVYAAILKRIEKSDYDVFDRRAVVPPVQKYWITLRRMAAPAVKWAWQS